jgi:hypothetical protein
LENTLFEKKRLERLLSEGTLTNVNNENIQELKVDLAEAQERVKTVSGDYNFLLRSMNHYQELYNRDVQTKTLIIENLKDENGV